MKGVHFYVLSALLGVLLSNSNIVVRKNILFAFRQRPFTQYCKIEIVRLRFVQMKGMHFYVLSALLGIFTE